MRSFNPTIVRVATALACMAGLGGCVSSDASVQVISQASGSSYFSLAPPGVYTSGDHLQVTGRACRRARTILLSPSRIRLEKVTSDGAILNTAVAPRAAIYANADQPCSDYSVRVSWPLAPGETVRACFDRGRPCPSQASAKTLVNAPTLAPAR